MRGVTRHSPPCPPLWAPELRTLDNRQLPPALPAPATPSQRPLCCTVCPGLFTMITFKHVCTASSFLVRITSVEKIPRTRKPEVKSTDILRALPTSHQTAAEGPCRNPRLTWVSLEAPADTTATQSPANSVGELFELLFCPV